MPVPPFSFHIFLSSNSRPCQAHGPPSACLRRPSRRPSSCRMLNFYGVIRETGFFAVKKCREAELPACISSISGTDVRVLTHGSPCRPLLLRVRLVDGEAFRRHFLGERKVAFRKVLLPDLRKQPFQISLRVEPVDKRVLDQRRRCA